MKELIKKTFPVLNKKQRQQPPPPALSTRVVIEHQTVYKKKTFKSLRIQTLISLLHSLITINENEDDHNKKNQQIKEIFLCEQQKPIIKAKEIKNSSFLSFSSDDLYWHSFYYGTSGVGKSYFSEIILIEKVQHGLLHFLESILAFMETYQVNDEILIALNFQHQWQTIINNIQNELIKIEEQNKKTP